MGKRLIINADDFGMGQDTDKAILELGSNGLITSTTIMANLANRESLGQLKELENISKGIHFNITDGFPVSNPSDVSSLLNKRGQFYSLNKLVSAFAAGKVVRSHIEHEFCSQLELLKRSGLEISHADSHNHIHQFPFLGPVILSIFYNCGISRVRNCHVCDRSNARMTGFNLIYGLSGLQNDLFAHPEVLISGFSSSRRPNLDLFIHCVKKAFKNHDVAELLTHPSMSDIKGSYLHRRSEYLLLRDGQWKYSLDGMEIKLVNYYDL